MLMTGLEQVSFAKGEEKERKKSREDMIDLLTTLHFSKEEINKYLKKYGHEPLPE